MNATYRRKQWSILLGLLATLFGIGFGIAGCCALMEPPSPDTPSLGPTGLAILCIFPTLLLGVGGPWMIADAIRHRLTIDGDDVIQVLAFRTERINLAEIVEARWRRGQDGGHLTLKTPNEKIKLEFYGYSRKQSRQLIKFLHLRLPATVQEGWDKYWEFTWRMFDVPDPARREEFAEETHRLRRRLLILLLLSSGVLVFIVVVVWFYTRTAESLKQLVFLVLLLPIVFLVSASRGKIAEHPDVRPGFAASLLPSIGLLIMALGMCAAIPFAMLDMPITAQSVMFGGAGCGCLWTVIGSWRQQRTVRQTQSQAAKLAEQEYMQPEPAHDSGRRSP